MKIFLTVTLLQKFQLVCKIFKTGFNFLKVSLFRNRFWGRRFSPKNERKQVDRIIREFGRSFFGGNR